MTSPPTLVVVAGGGTMGAGIAHAFAAAGSAVVVLETDSLRASAALARVHETLASAEAKGKLTSAADAATRVRVSIVDIPADAQLYIEAVPEDAGLKRDVLLRLESAAGADAVVATNTSSLSVTDLAAVLVRPERFCGMHFFNPVPASALVELVRHPGSADGVLEQARQWVSALGKESIVVADSPGFATSRLGVAVGLEAIRMVADGVASPADIDTGMRLGYRWPMGPLRLGDLVGLDVRLGIAEHLAATLGPRFDPPQLLRDMVARGDLGAKSGRGFYDWPEK